MTDRHTSERWHLPAVSRREILQAAGGGFAACAAEALFGGEVARRVGPHHQPRARAVIQLFMLGGASQCDLFDYKPALQSRGGEQVAFTVSGGTVSKPGPLLASPWKWRQHGECGRWVSDALPHLAGHVDDMAFLMAMKSPTSEHSSGATLQLSGFLMPGFPSAGSWVSYALGTASEELPAFVALPDPVGLPWTGKNSWSNGFLPAVHQGTMLLPSAANPVPDLFPAREAAFVTSAAEADARGLLADINRQHLREVGSDSRLEARIKAAELAARMQLAVPQLLAIDDESPVCRTLYGLDDPRTAPIGRNCLIARRLVERGVRFVQLWVGSGLNGAAGNWDNHGSVLAGSDFEKMCIRSDRPIAGLLTDLKARGLLDETIVLWTTEFGRTPYSQGNNGRDHNGNTFVSWMAGGGVRGGSTYGESDEFSYAAAVNTTTCYDQHATMLHLLGYDHKRVTFRHNGVDRRLTDVHGHVIPDIVA